MYSALYGNDALKIDQKWLAEVFLSTMCIKISPFTDTISRNGKFSYKVL